MNSAFHTHFWKTTRTSCFPLYIHQRIFHLEPALLLKLWLKLLLLKLWLKLLRLELLLKLLLLKLWLKLLLSPVPKLGRVERSFKRVINFLNATLKFPCGFAD